MKARMNKVATTVRQAMYYRYGKINRKREQEKNSESNTPKSN